MDYRKTLERIRRLESEIAYADPARAAHLTREIVHLKMPSFAGTNSRSAADFRGITDYRFAFRSCPRPRSGLPGFALAAQILRRKGVQ